MTQWMVAWSAPCAPHDREQVFDSYEEAQAWFDYCVRGWDPDSASYTKMYRREVTNWELVV